MLQTPEVSRHPRLANGQSLPLGEVPWLPESEFRAAVAGRVRAGERLSALFGHPLPGGDGVRLYAVTSDPGTATLGLFATDVGDRYESLTPECPQAHWFEREIAEQWGVVPEGHPWLKPIRFHASYREGHDAWGREPGEAILPCVQPAGADYFKVRGEEVHEVAVGPIHAGVIEPGHFRLQCHGEHVFTLE
ncbi:MAG TPA: NADH-quinone oxidoreductase subunit C, partial [Gemmataceae bacterium]